MKEYEQFVKLSNTYKDDDELGHLFLYYKTIRMAANSSISKLSIDKDDKHSKIYHYTSMDSLHKIATNVTKSKDTEYGWSNIRATSASFLNDPLELIYSTNLLDQWISQYSDEMIEIAISDVVSDDGVDLVLARRCGELAINILTEYIKNPEAHSKYTFISSFTTKRNDLYSWYVYGDKCKGAMLGINSKRLANIRSSEIILVEYDKKKQVQKIRKLLKDLLRVVVLSEMTKAKALTIDPELVPYNFENIVNHMITIFALSNKDVVHSQEAECRIIAQTDNDDSYCSEDVMFYSNEGRIVPYIELRMTKNEPLPIEEIMLGPAVTERTLMAVNIMLESPIYSLEMEKDLYLKATRSSIKVSI